MAILQEAALSCAKILGRPLFHFMYEEAVSPICEDNAVVIRAAL